MKDLSITEFRRQCLSLLEDLPDDGIVISKRGKPLARITPIRPPKRGDRVKPPLLKGHGKRGPQCPVYETPYDLVFD